MNSFVWPKNNLFVVKLSCVFIAILVFVASCQMDKDKKNTDDIQTPDAVLDFQNILKRGKLIVLAENSSTSYFIYREKEMGFEFELLEEFARELGVELEIKIVADLDDIVGMLQRGEGDIVACNYTVTKDRTKVIDFSIPYMQSPQILVQKKPDGFEKMKPEELDKLMIRDASQLAGKTVNVWRNSSYYQRLVHLQDEIGDTIYVDPVNGLVGSEELIELVSEGLIDYTIVEQNSAKISQRFYDNLDVSTTLSANQNIAFGVRKSSSLLKAKINNWLTKFLKSSTFSYIYKKYFDVGTISMNSQDTFVIPKGGKISPYDEIFKQAGAKYGTNWLLLAAVAYQESKFNPTAESFGGAYGMMQFMPNTGPHYGVYPDSPPDVQIMGGMKKLTADIRYWKDIPNPEQREKFALASYNAGGGHVQDAQRLAKKHGLDPNMWDDNVENMILNLSKQEFYRDEVVKYGAMRGTTTYKYVQHVYDRYLDWKLKYK